MLFPTKKRLGQVLDELATLRREIENIKADNERVRLQASDLYESAHRLHDKIRKRVSRDAARNEPQELELDLNERILRGLPIDATTSR